MISRFLPLFLTALSFSLAPVKGGSVSFQELEAVVKSNHQFDALFLHALVLTEHGEGNRLGAHFRDAAAARVGPYRFQGRFAADSGSSFPLEVVLHTDWWLEDNDGNTYRAESGDLPEPPADDRPLTIREVLVRVEIIDPAGGSALPPGDPAHAAGGSSMPPAETPGSPQNGGGNSNPPASASGSGQISGTFAQGDYLYAGEYYCDTYQINLAAGQTLKATLSADSVRPELMSKIGGWFGASGPRNAAAQLGESTELTHSATSAGSFLLLVTNREKHTASPYTLSLTLDGHPLPIPSPLPAPQTDKRIVPLN